MIAETFFTLSKAAWLVLAPSNLLALLAGLSLLLLVRKAWRGLGRRFLSVVGAGFALVCFLPIGDGALDVLERRFPPLPVCVAQQQVAVAGILLLGGALSSIERDGASIALLHESADRVRYAAELARAFPETPVLVSGGVALPRPGAVSEAVLMAELLGEWGVPASRLILETGSRTTTENARNAAALSARKPEDAKRPFLLVTSAFHMPRAVGAARAQGLHVLPAPTDWRIDRHAPMASFSATAQLANLDIAAKEFLGLAAYAATGRSSELFPAPEPAPCARAPDQENRGL